MKKLLSFFSLLLMAAVQSWASLPTPKVEYVQLYENGPKWATMNLGATSVTDAGLYFWWGDVVGHAKGEAYNFSDSNTDIASYVNDEGYVADGRLVAEKDAATQMLGAGYRIPTKDEFDALINNCDCAIDVDSQGKVLGYRVSGKGEYAGNSIYLPATGFGQGEAIVSEDRVGSYWTSSSDSYGGDYDAQPFVFSSEYLGTTMGVRRYTGFPIRPVCDAQDLAQAAYDYLVSLIGNKRYADSEQNFTVCLNQDDEVQLLFGSYVVDVFDYQDLVVNGNEYYLNNKNDLKFVVEDGAVAHVYAMEYDEVILEFFEKAPATPYEQLVSLVGDKVFEANGLAICLDKDGVLQMSYDSYNSVVFDPESVFVVEDGYYIGRSSLKFVVEDGVLTHIYAMGGDEVVFEFIERAPAEFVPGTAEDYQYIISLIGDKTYEKDYIALYVNEDGELQIDFGEGDIDVYSSDILSVSDNLYIFEDPHVFPKIKIVLASDDIAHIYAMVDDEIIFEFVENVSGTPTAIDAVDAAESLKTIKTIENGKVVIIRGDKKYDLTGREL